MASRSGGQPVKRKSHAKHQRAFSLGVILACILLVGCESAAGRSIDRAAHFPSRRDNDIGNGNSNNNNDNNNSNNNNSNNNKCCTGQLGLSADACKEVRALHFHLAVCSL